MGETLNRRELLVAAGGLAAAASPLTSACAVAKKGSMAGYAIVGLGYYATQIIMPQFENCKQSKITALVSGDPAKARRFADQYGVPERSIYNYRNFDRI